MRQGLAPSKNALLSSSGIAALLLAAWCSPSLAATGVDVDCPETAERSELIVAEITAPALTIPALTVEVADHGTATSDSIDDEFVDTPLAAPAASAASDEPETADSKETDQPVQESPAATRLPGVSEADGLRFRRQMYRTDI